MEEKEIMETAAETIEAAADTAAEAVETVAEAAAPAAEAAAETVEAAAETAEAAAEEVAEAAAETVEAAAEEVAEAAAEEAPETMDSFAEEIEKSLVKVKNGDLVEGTVAGISDTEVTVDLGTYSEGIIKLENLSNNPRFSIKRDIAVGDQIKAVVLSEDDGAGHILLSKKKADDILAWEELKEMMESGAPLDVKISSVVNGGVVTFLRGVRAFIPASHLALGYVENLQDYLNKVVTAKIITVDAAKKKLVLSVREVLKDLAAREKEEKISRIQIGDILEGKVETIKEYGAFIDLGDKISGLVHISQISPKRIQSVNEVLKIGEAVKVKVIALKDGKLSLSIKALLDPEPDQERKDRGDRPERSERRGRGKDREEHIEYKDNGKATTGLGTLLKGLNLDLKD